MWTLYKEGPCLLRTCVFAAKANKGKEQRKTQFAATACGLRGRAETKLRLSSPCDGDDDYDADGDGGGNMGNDDDGDVLRRW